MVVIPPMAMAVVLLIDSLLSHSMSHMFFLGLGHMRDNTYLHVRQIDIMYSIGSSTSLPSYACIRTLHVNPYTLEKYSAMAHCHKSMGSTLLTIGSLSNPGSYI